MTKKQCPLGEDCDLTIAWMKGAEDARDRAKARIDALTEQLEAARRDAEEAEAYAEELEGRLAKAVEAFKKLNVGEGWAAQIARATLAEIEGDKR
jgi:hypothetical protein